MSDQNPLPKRPRSVSIISGFCVLGAISILIFSVSEGRHSYMTFLKQNFADLASFYIEIVLLFTAGIFLWRGKNLGRWLFFTAYVERVGVNIFILCSSEALVGPDGNCYYNALPLPQ